MADGLARLMLRIDPEMKGVSRVVCREILSLGLHLCSLTIPSSTSHSSSPPLSSQSQMLPLSLSLLTKDRYPSFNTSIGKTWDRMHQQRQHEV